MSPDDQIAVIVGLSATMTAGFAFLLTGGPVEFIEWVLARIRALLERRGYSRHQLRRAAHGQAAFDYQSRTEGHASGEYTFHRLDKARLTTKHLDYLAETYRAEIDRLAGLRVRKETNEAYLEEQTTRARAKLDAHRAALAELRPEQEEPDPDPIRRGTPEQPVDEYGTPIGRADPHLPGQGLRWEELGPHTRGWLQRNKPEQARMMERAALQRHWAKRRHDTTGIVVLPAGVEYRNLQPTATAAEVDAGDDD